MGRVFSYEQTQTASKHIPSSDDFESAIGNFKSASMTEVANGTISGAVVYGSVAIRSYTQRSDFDCLIVPYDHSAESIAAIERIVTATDSAGKIEVSAIVHPKERLSKGAHEIDRYFGDHLTGQSRLVYGEDPKNYIQFPDYGGSTHLMSYIRHKKRSVATSFSKNNPDYYKGLQRTLELPLAIGRKTLRVLDELNQTHFAVSDSANKGKLEPACMQLFNDVGLGEVPYSIMQLNRAYTEVLIESINGNVDKEEYSTFLLKISEAGMMASKWLDDLDDYFEKQYESKAL